MYEKAFPFVSSLLFALAAAAMTALAGCQPQIGNQCALNTDCSVDGTRQCDTSMPGGYCTIFNCGPNSCPDQSACYLFYADLQGCPYNDHQPSRTAHSFCMKDCSQDGDCRAGYVCRDARKAPYDAILLDDNQQQAVCVPGPDATFSASGQLDAAAPAAPVCQANPDVDAAFPPAPDAGPPGADAGSDGGTPPDGAVDAGPSDAGIDATLDGGNDATTDAAFDASDAGPLDATLD